MGYFIMLLAFYKKMRYILRGIPKSMFSNINIANKLNLKWPYMLGRKFNVRSFQSDMFLDSNNIFSPIQAVLGSQATHLL